MGASNLGPLLRTCSAFSVRELLVTGPEPRRTGTHGAHGAQRHQRVALLPTIEASRAHARAEGATSLCGVVRRPVAGSVPVTARPFRGPTAFVVGSAAHGLGAAVRSAAAAAEGDDARRALEACDLIVHVPQRHWREPHAQHSPRARGAGTADVGAAADATDGATSECASDSSDVDAAAAAAAAAVADEGEDVEIALDPLATLAIALHHYTAWATVPERAVDGHKFRVGAAPRSGGAGAETPAVARDGNWRTRMWRVPAAWAATADDARSRAPLESLESDDEGSGGLGGLFGGGEPHDFL